MADIPWAVLVRWRRNPVVHVCRHDGCELRVSKKDGQCAFCAQTVAAKTRKRPETRTYVRRWGSDAAARLERQYTSGTCR